MMRGDEGRRRRPRRRRDGDETLGRARTIFREAWGAEALGEGAAEHEFRNRRPLRRKFWHKGIAEIGVMVVASRNIGVQRSDHRLVLGQRYLDFAIGRVHALRSDRVRKTKSLRREIGVQIGVERRLGACFHAQTEG